MQLEMASQAIICCCQTRSTEMSCVFLQATSSEKDVQDLDLEVQRRLAQLREMVPEHDYRTSQLWEDGNTVYTFTSLEHNSHGEMKEEVHGVYGPEQYLRFLDLELKMLGERPLQGSSSTPKPLSSHLIACLQSHCADEAALGKLQP